MYSAAGWWRGQPNSTVFDSCRVPKVCLSGPTLLTQGGGAWSTPCVTGYTGPMCDACVFGWGRDSSGGCSPCGSPALTWFAACAGFAGTVIILSFSVVARVLPDAGTLRERRSGNNVKVFVTYMQVHPLR